MDDTHSLNLIDRLGLPREITGAPRLTLVGDRQAMVENHRGLICLSPELVEVAGGRFSLRLRGEGMELLSMDGTVICLRGRIFTVEIV